MKDYSHIGSTFLIVAALLFGVNRLYEAITSIGLPVVYTLSIAEKLIYIASFVFLVVGLFFLWLAIKESRNK